MGFDRQRELVVSETGLQSKYPPLPLPANTGGREPGGHLTWRAEGDWQPNRFWVLNWAPPQQEPCPLIETGFLHFNDHLEVWGPL